MHEPGRVPVIACIVEGEGDERALPLLIRRIGLELQPSVYVEARVARRINRDRLVRQGGIEEAVDLTARVTAPSAGILVVVDADDDCPARLGPALLQRAQAARTDRRIGVVLAKSEYEAWFLAAAASIAGRRSLQSDLQPPAHPELVRGAKEWLGKRMETGRRYREVIDQPALTELFDLGQARRGADSFDKCYREIARLIQAQQEDR